MNQLKVRAHAALIGSTGFNKHAQHFFTHLAKHRPLEIRNFSVGDTWSDLSDEPHNGEHYVTAALKTAMVTQTVSVSSREFKDYQIYSNWPNPGEPEIELVLGETNHVYFYNSYWKYSIGYNVWEATRQPKEFFSRLLQFDEVWVPSEWQKAKTVEQGYPAERVIVVPEGVDGSTFYPTPEGSHKTDKMTFVIFGRWEPRKSTTEMIRAFIEEFSNGENVELIISADNRFARDGMSTTEERLKHYGLEDPRIKVIHFPSTEEYSKILRESHVFLSCSRSEGWNLPLLEAMASGTPSIYSNESGQLEFAKGRGLPVKIKREIPAIGFKDCGNWYEPDFSDLRRAIRDAYENWTEHKAKAVKDSHEIREQFSWERAAEIANNRLLEIQDRIIDVNRARIQPDSIKYNAIRGAFLEVIRKDPGEFQAEFIDNSTGLTEFSQKVENNMWIRSSRNYYVDWRFKVKDLKTGEILLDDTLNLKGSRVMVAIESRSLGDNLSWFPAVEEFRKKHECKMVCSTFWNHLFKDNYPEIEFIEPGQAVSDIVAMYSIGWYYDDNGNIRNTMNPKEVKTQPMQKTAFDILGLDYTEIKPIINLPKNIKKSRKISIAIHGTCQTKYWNNPTGWQEVVDWCNQNDYEVVLLSVEQDGFMGNSHPTGIRHLTPGPIEGAIAELASSEAFVGIGSGLTWLAWTVGTPVILVSGFSENYTEMQGISRIGAPAGKCSGCFNSHRLDPADWNWCPVNKGTNRQFECSKSIEASTVINELKRVLGLK